MCGPFRAKAEFQTRYIAGAILGILRPDAEHYRNSDHTKQRGALF